MRITGLSTDTPTLVLAFLKKNDNFYSPAEISAIVEYHNWVGTRSFDEVCEILGILK